MFWIIFLVWFIVALATMGFISGPYNKSIAVDEEDEIPYYKAITLGLFWPFILPVFIVHCIIRTLKELKSKNE
jgi:uncharacterized membrane protein YhaH (DUF805 family)